MRTLFYFTLCPFSRRVRLALAEKGIEATLTLEHPWARNPGFLALNPAGDTPVLIDDDAPPIADATAICEYLEETTPTPPLIPRQPSARAEMRRLVAWFDRKFDDEVTRCIVNEKVHRRLARDGSPDSVAMHAGRANIRIHLDYIGWLAERRKWLAGDDLTLADLAAAAHLSCLDYLGDVPWAHCEAAKTWYARVKSRPSFRALLSERVPLIRCAAHYDNLDF